jgi:hypothetical protein
MQIVANESHINTRKKIGERAPFAGLLVLAVSVVLVFARPEWIWQTMILVWVGFLISLIGSYLGDRFVGPNAQHKRVPDALKGLDNNYMLLMYKLPVPFVLLEPGGLTVLSIRSQGGKVSYDGERWQQKQKMGLLRRFAGQEALGRPHRTADAEREYLENHLAKRLPNDVKIPVRAVILFTNPDLELHVDSEKLPVPALRTAGLKRWVRKEPMRPNLSIEQRSALVELLDLSEEARAKLVRTA